MITSTVNENNFGKTVSLADYEKAVKNLAELKSNYIFPNENATHAGIVLKTMLNTAKNEVKIFDDDLSGDISGLSESFLADLQKFAESGKSLKIVVRNNGKLQGEIVKVLYQLVQRFPDTIEVREASPSFIAEVETIGEELADVKHINFAVGDKTAFRLEFPAGSRMAFCSFNNETYSKKLSESFDKFYGGCDDYFATTKVGSATHF